MATAVKLSEGLVELARRYAVAEHRSAPKQIEYWAAVGRAAIDNPDLPISFVIDSLKSKRQADEGLISPYEFG